MMMRHHREVCAEYLKKFEEMLGLSGGPLPAVGESEGG